MRDCWQSLLSVLQKSLKQRNAKYHSRCLGWKEKRKRETMVNKHTGNSRRHEGKLSEGEAFRNTGEHSGQGQCPWVYLSTPPSSHPHLCSSYFPLWSHLSQLQLLPRMPHMWIRHTSSHMALEKFKHLLLCTVLDFPTNHFSFNYFQNKPCIYYFNNWIIKEA